MAAYRRVYDSHHLQADCEEPGSAPEPSGCDLNAGRSAPESSMLTTRLPSGCVKVT